jgi:hypothetical protein
MDGSVLRVIMKSLYDGSDGGDDEFIIMIMI